MTFKDRKRNRYVRVHPQPTLAPCTAATNTFGKLPSTSASLPPAAISASMVFSGPPIARPAQKCLPLPFLYQSARNPIALLYPSSPSNARLHIDPQEANSHQNDLDIGFLPRPYQSFSQLIIRLRRECICNLRFIVADQHRTFRQSFHRHCLKAWRRHSEKVCMRTRTTINYRHFGWI